VGELEGKKAQYGQTSDSTGDFKRGGTISVRQPKLEGKGGMTWRRKGKSGHEIPQTQIPNIL